MLGVVDVATGRSVEQEAECGANGPDGVLLWSPDGDRIATGCYDSYEIYDSAKLTNVASIKAPNGAQFEAARWQVFDHLVLAASNRSGNSSDMLRADAETGALEIMGHLRVPELGTGYARSSYSLDLHREIVDAGPRKRTQPSATPGPPELAFVIDAAGAAPKAVPPATREDVGWAADGRSIVYVDQTGSPALRWLDLDPVRLTTVRTLPDDYYQGIWRIP